jgi:hypothetical protein
MDLGRARRGLFVLSGMGAGGWVVVMAAPDGAYGGGATCAGRRLADAACMLHPPAWRRLWRWRFGVKLSDS